MKKRTVILIHLLFWIVRLAPLSGDSSIWQLGVSFGIVSFATFYINYFSVMPLLFSRKRYGWAGLAWIGVLVFFTGFRYAIEELLFPAWLGFRNYYPGTSLLHYLADNIAYYALPVVLFSAAIWLLVNYIRNLGENAELKLEKQRAELNFLKSQINPHFLFNNLNSIYALVYRHSDKALPAIRKLSDIMRYMVREAALDLIPLRRELQYVEDLIGLQELRVAGEAQVRLEVHGDTDAVQIPPLLLIPFVENGFKHGDITDPGQPFLIRLHLHRNRLHLYTENKIAKGNKDGTGGLGLSNLGHRLKLLYPGAHRLEYGEHQGIYICRLELQLGSCHTSGPAPAHGNIPAQ